MYKGNENMVESVHKGYSVLMSVYHKENPKYLRQAMDSMWNQTLPPDDFVLVCDGPLNQQLDAVISEMQQRHSQLNVVRLETNVGLGCALNKGIQCCKCDFIARMDSDDIARPERCEKEWNYLTNHPEVSIVGGWIEEFSTTPESVEAIRKVPENEEEIKAFARKRNPFNHPSVMLRKQDALAVGNYSDVRYLQDYYLWTAMLIQGYRGHNLQEPLVWMRANENLFKRRSGSLYVKIQLDLFRIMLKNGFITTPQYLSSCVIRICSGIAPNWMRRFMFKKILRK